MNDISYSLEVSKDSAMWFGSPKLCIRKSGYSPIVKKSRQHVCLMDINSYKIQGISRSRRAELCCCCVK